MFIKKTYTKGQTPHSVTNDRHVGFLEDMADAINLQYYAPLGKDHSIG